jgi:hypothetical protein
MADTLARMRQLVGTTAEWSANNLILGDGELAAERLADGTLGLRLGNGALPFSQAPAFGYQSLTVITGDGVTDKSAAITAANAAGKPVLFIGVAHVASPTTITVPIVDTTAQIFTQASQITIANGLPVRPDWFGAALANAVRLAWSCLPQPTGGVVLLRYGQRYKDNGLSFGGLYMDRDNITLRGEGMPRPSDDLRTLQGGSIIEGLLLVYANNFVLENFGVDCGATAKGAASATDAIVCTYPSAAMQAAATLRKRGRLTNVVGLVKSPTDPFHGVIVAEGMSDVTTTGDVIGIMGIHGVVIKAANVNCAHLQGWCNSSDGVIIKTDTQATAASLGVKVDKITALAGAPSGYTPYATVTPGVNFGLFLHAFGGALGPIQIGTVYAAGHGYGVRMQMDVATAVDNIQIDQITTESNATAGVHLYGPAANEVFRRVQLGRVVTRNTPIGMVCQWVTPSNVTVEKLHAVNCSKAALACTSESVPLLDTIAAENCGAIYEFTSNGKALVGQSIKIGTTTADYAATGLVPALANSWAQIGGGDVVRFALAGYGVELYGLVSGGTTNVTFATLPPYLRPATEKRGLLQGRGGAGQSAVPYQLSAAGVFTINDVAGGVANANQYLSLLGAKYPLTS